MKNRVRLLAGAISVWIMTFMAGAEGETASEAGQAVDLIGMAKFFGYFLLVMGVIFGALLLTGWIGKKIQNRKK